MIFSIEGQVIHGDQYGRTLGFPTANIRLAEEYTQYPTGIYAGLVTHNNHKYPSAIIISNVENKVAGQKIEAHILDYSTTIYNETLLLEAVSKIRDYKIFEDEEQLIQAIRDDIKKIKQVLQSKRLL